MATYITAALATLARLSANVNTNATDYPGMLFKITNFTTCECNRICEWLTNLVRSCSTAILWSAWCSAQYVRSDCRWWPCVFALQQSAEKRINIWIPATRQYTPQSRLRISSSTFIQSDRIGEKSPKTLFLRFMMTTLSWHRVNHLTTLFVKLPSFKTCQLKQILVARYVVKLWIESR